MKFKTAFWLDVNERPEKGGAANVCSFGPLTPGPIMEGWRRYKISFDIPDLNKPDVFDQPSMERVIE